MKEYTSCNSNEEENNHIIHLWEPLEFNIDENYEYVPKSKIFTFFSNLLYYGIAFPILKVLTKVVYDLKIEGKENIRNIEGGIISVSNHVLVLDCAMVGLVWGAKRVYFTTLESSFKIPFVRRLIKLLRAIPIPKDIKNKKFFIKAIDGILKKGNVVHFYPESALWPYCSKIRNLKNGAFDFAIRNQVSVVPMVFKFRKPNGIRKILKRNPDVTLKVLKPIQIEKCNISKKTEELKQIVYEKMKKESLKL